MKKFKTPELVLGVGQRLTKVTMNSIVSPELLPLMDLPQHKIFDINCPTQINGGLSFFVTHLLANNISLVLKWIELNYSNLLNFKVDIHCRVNHEFHVHLASKSLFADYSDFQNGYFNFVSEKLFLKFPKLIVHIHPLEIHESFLIGPADNEIGIIAAQLSMILDRMGHKDQLFVLGPKSTSIGKSIISTTANSPRRNSESNIALILIDREMDIKTAARCNQGILDRLYNLLSDGYKTCLFSDSDICSLKLDKYGIKNDVLEFLHVLSGMELKTGLSVVRYMKFCNLRKKILDVLSEDIQFNNSKKVLGKVTKEQLHEFFTPAKDNWDIIRKRPQLYQFLSAFLDLLDHPYCYFLLT
jgi:hypothetical protein